MQLCWIILGIEPTDDVQAIKRAYTKLAHEVNPEDDPDRFRKLHEAYKMALAYANKSIVISGLSDSCAISEEHPKESYDTYDFSQLSDDSVLQGTLVEIMADDILIFKENNDLCSVKDLSNIPHNIKMNLAESLFKMYARLAQISNDANVWNDFFDEPLIMYAWQHGFCNRVICYFPKGSDHGVRINEIIRERHLPLNVNYSQYNDCGEQKNTTKRDLLIVIMIIIGVACFLGCMIVFATDMFGDKNINAIVGCSLIAVSTSGVFIAARIISVKNGLVCGFKKHNRNKAK